MARQEKIARSIAQAINPGDADRRSSVLLTVKEFLVAFFALYRLRLTRYHDELFRQLRHTWHISESDYLSTFENEHKLKSTGDMGYSGSTFFTSTDGDYLIKSVPRPFEHEFFRDDLLKAYADHMSENLDSLLIRITDFLVWNRTSLGGLLRVVPTHHIVMESLLTGKDQAPNGDKWQTWDLKPESYFFPERDIAGGRLASEATKSRLADVFEDKLALTQPQASDFLDKLLNDTKLLETKNAVDYSLFLVRIPVDVVQNPFADGSDEENDPEPPNSPPHAPPNAPTWRTGIKSADGRYVFRAAVLDFFWAKHKTQAKIMTFLVNTYNIFDRKGPMSITTTPQEYRARFLDMCREMIDVKKETLAGRRQNIKPHDQS